MRAAWDKSHIDFDGARISLLNDLSRALKAKDIIYTL